MAGRVERQPAHRIDIIFQFTHAFAGIRIDPGEILRIITGEDQAFRPNPLKPAIERDDSAFETCHIEIDTIVIVGEWFLQRAETLAFADQSIFDRGDTPAEMRINDLELLETMYNPAGHRIRRCAEEAGL